MSLVFHKVIPRPVTAKGKKCPNSDLNGREEEPLNKLRGARYSGKQKKDFQQSVWELAMVFSIQFCPCIFMHGLFLYVIKLPSEASVLFLPFLLFYFFSSSYPELAL